MKDVRMPIASGRFYPDGKEELYSLIEQCFLNKDRRVAKTPKLNQSFSGYSGVIVPHAGISISGPIAAHSYNWLAKRGFADIIVIIGPNHTGFGSAISLYSKGAWRTPLGEVRIDEQFAKSLIDLGVSVDTSAHQYEHSIEVQIPFLQYLSEENGFTLVPIAMLNQDFETAESLGKNIAKVCKMYPNKRIAIIASTDFSHVGPNYSVYPKGGIKSHEYARMQDEKAIGKILDFDARGLIETVSNEKISMCGFGPVAAMMVAMKILGAQSVELLKYGNSYEVWPDSSVVGYGSLAVC